MINGVDVDDNMTNDGDINFTWDCENRLVSVGNGTTNIINVYDYKHRRVRKTVNGESRAFVYDGWNLISETTSAEVRHYFWGLDLSDSLQGAGGVGGLLAVSQSGSMYYPVYDNNGNVTAYLDDLGNIVAAYEYNAFGETISQSGNKANDFAFRFSTKYHDNETGLYYYGYRFYNPALCTWLNRDPIEEEGGLNLYGFNRNDGVNKYDLLGMSAWAGLGRVAIQILYEINRIGVVSLSTPEYDSALARAMYELKLGYNAMKAANLIGADKYFHCVSMCKATRASGDSELVEALAILREITDNVKNRFNRRLPDLDQALDSFQDMKANRTGIKCPKSESCECCCRLYKVKGL